MNVTRSPALPAPNLAAAAQFHIRGGLIGLVDSLLALHAEGNKGVLGIIYAVEGSTYQKPGTLVLLDKTGLRYGAISGGCLEPELEEKARIVLETETAVTVDFDTQSNKDLIFGSGTGCRGRMHLVLIPQAPKAPLTDHLVKLVKADAGLELCLRVKGPDIGSGISSLSGEKRFWGCDGLAHDFAIDESLNNDETGIRLHIGRPPKVLLLGAGPETPPLYLFIQRLGWNACIAEHRKRWLTFAYAAGMIEIIELPPQDAINMWQAKSLNAAVIMTHNYELDMKHLRLCARMEFSYIGLLGPIARRDALLAELGHADRESLQKRLHAPVGLKLGGSGPEALALSIVAELQYHFVS